jgi:hypothetical protein
MVGAHAHEPGVRGQVVDPVRDHHAQLLIREAVVADLDRVPLGCQDRPGWANRPTFSRFLVSTLITGCPAPMCSAACTGLRAQQQQQPLPLIQMRKDLPEHRY